MMTLDGIEYVSTTEAAKRCGLKRNAIADYARQGRVLHPLTLQPVVKGAGLPWLIPLHPDTGVPVVAGPEVKRRTPEWRAAE